MTAAQREKLRIQVQMTPPTETTWDGATATEWIIVDKKIILALIDDADMAESHRAMRAWAEIMHREAEHDT